MNNYQLYRTNIALGGQLKWDLYVESDSNKLVVNDVKLTPIIDSLPFNVAAENNPLKTPLQDKCAHLENISKYYKKIEGSFYNPYTNPLLEMNSPIIVPDDYDEHKCNFIDTHNGDLEMGIKRSRYSYTKKQFEYFCPVWLEDFGPDDKLEFEFIIRTLKGMDEYRYQKMISKTLVFTKYNDIQSNNHNKFIDYFGNYLSYICNSSKIIGDELVKIDLNNHKSLIQGIDVKEGICRIKYIDKLASSMLESEKLLMDSDKLIIDCFKNNHMIPKQLFNFNFIFDIDDFLVPNMLELMYGATLRMDIVVKKNGHALDLRDFYSNYEFIKSEPIGRINKYGKGEIEEDENINIFDTIADHRNPSLTARNKVNQDIIHWSMCGDNEYIFNLYSGYCGHITASTVDDRKISGNIDINELTNALAKTTDAAKFSEILNNNKTLADLLFYILKYMNIACAEYSSNNIDWENIDNVLINTSLFGNNADSIYQRYVFSWMDKVGEEDEIEESQDVLPDNLRDNTLIYDQSLDIKDEPVISANQQITNLGGDISRDSASIKTVVQNSDIVIDMGPAIVNHDENGKPKIIIDDGYIIKDDEDNKPIIDDGYIIGPDQNSDIPDDDDDTGDDNIDNNGTFNNNGHPDKNDNTNKYSIVNTFIIRCKDFLKFIKVDDSNKESIRKISNHEQLPLLVNVSAKDDKVYVDCIYPNLTYELALIPQFYQNSPDIWSTKYVEGSASLEWCKCIECSSAQSLSYLWEKCTYGSSNIDIKTSLLGDEWSRHMHYQEKMQSPIHCLVVVCPDTDTNDVLSHVEERLNDADDNALIHHTITIANVNKTNTDTSVNNLQIYKINDIHIIVVGKSQINKLCYVNFVAAAKNFVEKDTIKDEDLKKEFLVNELFNESNNTNIDDALKSKYGWLKWFYDLCKWIISYEIPGLYSLPILNYTPAIGPSKICTEVDHYISKKTITQLVRYGGKICPSFVLPDLNRIYIKQIIHNSEIRNSDFAKYSKTGYEPNYPSIKYYSWNPYKLQLSSNGRDIIKPSNGEILFPYEYKWYNDGVVLLLKPNIDMIIKIDTTNIKDVREVLINNIKQRLADLYHIEYNEKLVKNDYIDYVYGCYNWESNWEYAEKNNVNAYIYNIKLILK